MKRERDREKAKAAAGKAKIWVEKPLSPSDAGMDDELFAVLGYRVKASDMADVAQKLQQLEMAMGSNMSDGVSVLSTDTVHYNPSDLSGWVDSMLLELNNTASFETMQSQSGITGESSSNDIFRFPNNEQTQIGGGKFIYDEDLRAIPGVAIISNQRKDVVVVDDDDSESGNNKRMKSEFVDNSGSAPSEAAARPVVMVDSQYSGVKLVHTLMACAEAVQLGNMKLAGTLLKFVEVLAASQVGAMGKVATYFAQALSQKIYKKYTKDSMESDVLHMHFYEAGPYLKFAHFTANQAIFEAFAGATRVHVIDFSLNQGLQWPVLMQALATRPEGPPVFRLTGIGPLQPENNDALQEVGWKLTQLAERIGVKFEFRGFVANSLADLDVEMLGVRPSTVETVAVNAVFEMHRLLSQPGSIERVLELIRSMNPFIVTIVEQEANHNGAVFLDRFNESLHYYSTMFDSLESSAALSQPDSQDLMMTGVYLGRQICDVVAREGTDRVECHETLSQWRRRMNAAGFHPAPLGSDAFKQASMLLALFGGGDGYRVEESDGCLMLGWHTRPLIATSAWRLPAAGRGGAVVSRQGR